MKFFFSLICIGWLPACSALARSPVTLAIDTKHPGYAIPDDFAGVGFETWAEGPDRSGVSGRLFSPANTELITLFKNSGIRNLRLGGGTVDGYGATIPSRTDIDSVFGFARAAGVKVIYSFRLLNGNPAEAADAAKYIWDNYRPQLAYFAIGNEPDVRTYVYPPFGRGTDPAITNYSSYLATWRKFVAAVTNAVPDAPFAGPDAAGRIWASLFVKDEGRSGMVGLITQHEYVGGKPFIDDGRKNMPASEAVNNMLSENWVTNKYPSFYKKTLAAIALNDMPCRMTEANDYLRGVTNASNAFASALWALDYMHWWAAHGCAGVNFHNNQRREWLKTDTIYLDGGDYQINPKAYAIRAFDLGSHGRAEPVSLINKNGMNLTAYAVGDSTHLYVTIINKEHGPGARDASVTIEPDGFSFRNAGLMRLTAANGNVQATHGITLGGSSIANNAPWQGRWTDFDPPTDSRCTVVVKAASAVIVKLTSE